MRLAGLKFKVLAGLCYSWRLKGENGFFAFSIFLRPFAFLGSGPLSFSLQSLLLSSHTFSEPDPPPPIYENSHDDTESSWTNQTNFPVSRALTQYICKTSFAM